MGLVSCQLSVSLDGNEPMPMLVGITSPAVTHITYRVVH
jgi:hypothetical protein